MKISSDNKLINIFEHERVNRFCCSSSGWRQLALVMEEIVSAQQCAQTAMFWPKNGDHVDSGCKSGLNDWKIIMSRLADYFVVVGYDHEKGSK